MAKITVRWEIEDGYAGGARPHTMEIDSEDFQDLSDQQMSDLIFERADEDMRQTISVIVRNLNEVVEEIKEALAAEAEEADAET